MAGGPVYVAGHNETLDKQKVTVLNYALAVYAAIGSFLFGYDSGIIGSVISANYLYFQSYFNSPSDNVTGAIVSVFAGGAFFGALLAGWTADKYGRKRTIQMGSLISAVGCALQTGAPNIGALMAGRCIAGFAVGVLSMIVPLYQAECSPPHARGLLSGWTQQMISFGFFIASWAGYGCQFMQSNAQWRLALGIQIIPAVFLGLGMTFLPFSPRWLAAQGREEDALRTLKRLHGGRSSEAVVRAEYDEMVMQIEWERENVSSNIMDLFNTWPKLHRTLCGVMVQVCCQWTGVNVNSYFAPTIYAGLGYSGNVVLLINSVQSAFSLVVNFIFITFIVDRIGRRQPLIWGAVAMAVMLAWQAGIASLFAKPGYQNSGAGIAGILSIYFFSASFSLSYGPVSWIYQSEVFSMPLRAMGTSLSAASNWLMNVVISQFTKVGLANLGWKFFFIFVATNLGNAVIAYFLFPETKGLTLEELGAVFGDFDSVAPPTLANPPIAGDEEKKVGGAHAAHHE